MHMSNLLDFLCNINQYKFGANSSGVAVSDVILPPWAKGSPKLFIQMHRLKLYRNYMYNLFMILNLLLYILTILRRVFGSLLILIGLIFV